MKEKRFSPIQLMLAVFCGALVALAAAALAVWLYVGSGGFTMLRGYHIITDKFVGEYTPADVLDGTMDGMVTALGDRWSYYLTPEEYQQQNQRRANTYVGIGITVSYEREEGLLVRTVEPGGGAQEVGILPGELIVTAEGVSLEGDGKEQGIALISGEAGTDVVLEILGLDGTTRTVTARRKNMETHPVTYQLLPEKLGYIRVSNFYERSADEVKKAVEDLKAQGATGLLFDMRNNPGGYLPELTAMLDFLLPEGPIITTHGKNAPTQVTTSDASCVSLPMGVLVNGNTYSAAELFAAQLRESVGAKIVGEPTCGKGYSQQSFSLPNGGAVGISTGVYTTGGGVSLVGVGITPDRVLPLGETGDGQLDAAVALMLE
ncbi:MAG: S41 family peptidase [Oscillospiraceae bacterium]